MMFLPMALDPLATLSRMPRMPEYAQSWRRSNGRGGMSEGEAYYLAVFAFAFLCFVVGAVMLIGSAYERNGSSARFWAGWFVASSLSAVYCIERLVSGGGAA